MQNRTKNKTSRVYSLLAYSLIIGLIWILAGCGSDGASPTITSTGYFYSNWSCGNQGQCIAVMGHNVGSAGPFCGSSGCLAWNKQYIPGASSCNAAAIYPIYNFPPAGTCQN